MKPEAIAWDFDGTLIQGGWDKGLHLMYAAWVACDEHGWKDILRPSEPAHDIERMIRAYMRYLGAPRFHQLHAILNSLMHDRPENCDLAELGAGPAREATYPALRARYNELYSALNDLAADRYWRPFPSTLATLAALAKDYDLYVASGVLTEILEKDLDRHGFDRSVFQGIWGADGQGQGGDKADLLRRIRARGYRAVLFVGNSVGDLDYATRAGVPFYRIRDDSSYGRLRELLPRGFPNETERWNEAEEAIPFYRVKLARMLRMYVAGRPMTLEAISAWIHEEQGGA